MKQKILIVDDDDSIRMSLKLLLEHNYDPIAVSSGEDALARLNQMHIDAILLDVKMKGMDGLETLRKIRERHEFLVVIMLTVLEDISTAVTAIKLGANDYLRKPYDKDEILMALEKNLAMRNENREIQYLRSEINRIYESSVIIGNSKILKDVFTLIDKAVTSEATILIAGETGTGKELVARELHRRSAQREKPLVVVNCAAIPKDLMESELFGHEKGAFTGAHKQKLGKIEIASDGIVFFDEIGCLPLELQSKMLRVLQEKAFERVGGTVTIPTNARFVFATNQDLKKAVQENTFREDLYYRINVFPIKIPPLRERKEDIPLLVNHFMKKFSAKQHKNVQRISPECLDYFISYPWYGNVRQLENEMEKIVTLADYNKTTITPDIVSEDIRDTEENMTVAEGSGMLMNVLETLEKKMIREALIKFDGNKTKAAEYLGISRRGLHKKLNRFGELMSE